MSKVQMKLLTLIWVTLLTLDSLQAIAQPVKTITVTSPNPNRSNQQKVLQDGWENCLKDFAKLVATKNSDPAEIVVRAAFVSCSKYENALFYYFEKKLGNTSNPKLREYGKSWLVTDFFPAIKKHNADTVIETVLIARTK